MVTLLRTRAAPKLTVEAIRTALAEERDHVRKGVAFTVVDAKSDPRHLIITVSPPKGARTTALDESLEGSDVRWGEDFIGRGELLFVDPDEARLVVRRATGPTPVKDEVVRLFQRDFLTPLIELWSEPHFAATAASLSRPATKNPTEPPEKPVGAAFEELRTRQREAVLMSVKPRALLIGPPGTGKTHTVGAIAAYLLTRFKQATILLVGPTNNATDEALVSTARWLAKHGRPPGSIAMTRLGSRFDATKFTEHEHLIERSVLEAAKLIAVLEADEPSKKNVEAYAAWRESIESARKALRQNVVSALIASRLVAITTASCLQWYGSIAQRSWDFVICDEASQVPLPAALMLGRLGHRVLFAGDPNQLAPVVQCGDASAKHILSKTAFDSLPGHARTQLNEQSRMASAICKAVGNVFYGGELSVCRRSIKSAEWRRQREPYFIEGRPVPPLTVGWIGEECTWSAKYGGFIRFQSAKTATEVVALFMGSYVDAKDILVLTPFRAQRALIKNLLRAGERDVRVSTVHRSQGTERTILIFDPVSAGERFLKSEDGRRLINVAVSRAMNHVVLLLNKSDLANRWIRQLHEHALAGSADTDPFSFGRT